MREEGKTIYSTKLARKLIKEGFKLLDVKPNKINPDRTVFIFEYSAELRSILQEYKDATSQYSLGTSL